MSRERVINALKMFGFSNIGAKVYVFLAKQGSRRPIEIVAALNLPEHKVYDSLKQLQKKRIVEASIEYPLRYVAVPFEEVIDLLIEIKKEQAKIIQESREELLSSWRETIKKTQKVNEEES